MSQNLPKLLLNEGVGADSATAISDTYVFPAEEYEVIDEAAKAGALAGVGTVASGDLSTLSVLRTIKGPVAEWGKLNRNRRNYTERLWDNTLNSDYVKEQLAHKTLFGEANHPEGRYEVLFEKVSHRILEMHKVPETNRIHATIQILNTPLGRLLNTLYESGSIIGYSSRAGGTLKQYKDHSDVDEATYNFITFDAVPYPSVECARPVDAVSEGASNEAVRFERVVLDDSVHGSLMATISESVNNGDSPDMFASFFSAISENYDVSRELDYINNIRTTEKEGSSVSHAAQGDVLASQATAVLLENTTSLLKQTSAQLASEKASRGAAEISRNQIQENYNSLFADYQKTAAELMTSQSRVRELESRVGTVEESVKAEIRKQVLSESADTINGLQDTISEQSFIIDSYRISNDTASKQGVVIECLKQQLANANAENEYLRRCAAANDSSAVSENVYQQLAAANAHLQRVLESSLAEINRLEQQASAAITPPVTESVSEVAELQSKIVLLEQSLTAAQAQLAENSDNEWRREFVSAVAANYGVPVDAVLGKLQEDFSKYEVYSVCESLKAQFSARSAFPFSRVTHIDMGNSDKSVNESADHGNAETSRSSSSLSSLFSAGRRASR